VPPVPQRSGRSAEALMLRSGSGRWDVSPVAEGLSCGSSLDIIAAAGQRERRLVMVPAACSPTSSSLEARPAHILSLALAYAVILVNHTSRTVKLRYLENATLQIDACLLVMV